MICCERCGEPAPRLHPTWVRGRFGAVVKLACARCEGKMRVDPGNMRATRREVEQREKQREAEALERLLAKDLTAAVPQQPAQQQPLLDPWEARKQRLSRSFSGDVVHRLPRFVG